MLLLSAGCACAGGRHALPPRGCRAPTPLSLLLLHLLHLPLLLLQQLLVLLELLELLLLGPRHPLSLSVLGLSLLLLTPPAGALQHATQSETRCAKPGEARQKKSSAPIPSGVAEVSTETRTQTETHGMPHERSQMIRTCMLGYAGMAPPTFSADIICDT